MSESGGGSSPILDPWLEGLITNGDMIKANVANGMDKGDVLFVEKDDNGKLRTTWKEIMLSMIAGKLVVVREMQFADAASKVKFDVLTEAGFDGSGLYIRNVEDKYYIANSVDDAPVYEG